MTEITARFRGRELPASLYVLLVYQAASTVFDLLFFGSFVHSYACAQHVELPALTRWITDGEPLAILFLSGLLGAVFLLVFPARLARREESAPLVLYLLAANLLVAAAHKLAAVALVSPFRYLIRCIE